MAEREDDSRHVFLRYSSRSNLKTVVVVVSLFVVLSMFHLLGSAMLAPIDGSQEDKYVQGGTSYSTPDNTHAPSRSPETVTLQQDAPSAPTSGAPPHMQLHPDLSERTSFELPIPHPTNESSAFVDRWCDLSRVDWYPSDPSARQQPYFLIPGAKFTGTSVLSRMLLEHPKLAAPRPSREPGFFLDGNFRYVTGKEKTLVYAARKRLAAAHYPHNSLSFDASPGYLFYSSLVPRRILCVVPWVKLVVLLRDPVDRLLQQFAAARRRGYRKSLDEWVDDDFKLLRRVGVVTEQDTPLNIEQPEGRQKEDLAWYRYHTSPGEGGPLGRSLYDIQLRQWFQALQAAGRNPSSEVLIVWAENLASNPHDEYQRIVDFLGLPKASVQKETLQSLAARLKPRHNISPELRKKLDNFFKPYYHRLETLLKGYGVAMGK